MHRFLTGAKRQKVEVEGVDADPVCIASWNANSLGKRMSDGDWKEVIAFLKREKPCVFLVQEVKLPASESGSRKNRGKQEQYKKAYAKDYAVVQKCMRELDAASLHYKAYWSLADTKHAGSLMLISKKIKPRSVSFNITGLGPGEHEENGRIILAEFKTFGLLATYVPLNGVTVTRFQDRERWDAAVLSFLRSRRQEGTPCASDGAASASCASTRPLVWAGDLNACHHRDDVTDPEWFAKMFSDVRSGLKGEDAAAYKGGQCKVSQRLYLTQKQLHLMHEPTSKPQLCRNNKPTQIHNRVTYFCILSLSLQL
jgi:exonuclease III